MVEDRIMAAGLALLAPMISFPTCRHPGSNRAYSRPKLHPGTIPGPPTRARDISISVVIKEEEGHTGTDVADDVTVQVWHDHDVELLRLGNQLHRSVVDNHGIEFDTSVSVLLLCDSFTCVEEETISEFHNVGLVDTSDFLSSQPLYTLYVGRELPFGCS
jgi:hypothetical protein